MLVPRHHEVGPYFRHSVVATLLVFVLPAGLTIGLFAALSEPPPLVLTSGLAVLLSTLISAAGAEWWMRRNPETTVSFGDLMLWSWLRRKHAEQRLGEGVELFGIDTLTPTPAAVTHAEREERLKVLEGLNRALEAKDPYTRGHSQRVERHAYRTALAMGLDIEQVEEMRLAAALHDVGKIRVPDQIIRKPGPLTENEKSIMNEHSEVGAWMMAGVTSPAVVTAVRQHHERYDGKGYPDGIFGGDISLYARIIAVADTFDAITSTRPYRQKKERDYAVDVVRAEAGTQFDPEVVEAFLSGLPSAAPVAALLAAIPGLKGLARLLASVFRKAGAASLASGVGATGAVVMMAASFVVPTAHDLPAKSLPPIVAEDEAQEKSNVPKAIPSAAEVLGVRLDAFAGAPGLEGDDDGSAPGRRLGHAKNQPKGKALGRDHTRGATKGKHKGHHKHQKDHARGRGDSSDEHRQNNVPVAGVNLPDQAADVAEGHRRSLNKNRVGDRHRRDKEKDSG